MHSLLACLTSLSDPVGLSPSLAVGQEGISAEDKESVAAVRARLWRFHLYLAAWRRAMGLSRRPRPPGPSAPLGVSSPSPVFFRVSEL
jgi:hypothetical protein